MAEGSHVARRVAGQVERDFPALPTLPNAGLYDGLAFVQPAGTPLPALRPLRDAIAEIRRGPFDPAEDGLELLLVAFVRPVLLETGDWPVGLRLAASSASTLSSFVRDRRHDSAFDRPDGPLRFRQLDLWWNGRAHRIAVETLAQVPIATLWTMPPITLHPAAPRPLVRAARRTSASAVPLVKQPRERTRVSHAPIPLGDDGPDLFSQMNSELNAQLERTKLSSIFRQMRGADGERQPDDPGILANLAGWIRWHTPLGAALRRQYGERMNLVEKLIASGKLDDALKLALRLSASDSGGKPGQRFPNALPDARRSLDFEIQRGTAAPIMGQQGFQALQWRYRELAEQLEKNGDFRRAAYIHSQLLGDHHRAVQVLEKGEMYHEAAKLALSAKLPPVIAIRMLYLAGELDAALALARRTDCFEQLAEESRAKGGEFHAYVVKAWTDMLVATGQPLRALQVTDWLAQSREADIALFAARRGWLARAIGDSATEALPGELAARALLTVFWTSPDRDLRGIEAFPFMPAPGGSEGPFAPVLLQLQSWVSGEEEHGAVALLDLLAALVRLGGPDLVEQAGFWRGPAQPVVENLARAVLAVASSRLGQGDLQSLQSLLHKAKLPVMAADIPKLRKLHAAGPAPANEWRVPAAGAKRPAIRAACLLGDGSIVIWRESNVLELLDRHGAPRWRQIVGDVTAIVAIGTSPHAILIQRQRDGSSLLTRFSAAGRSFHPIGAIDLTAHHDITSEGQWMVQIGGEIGALDLVKLCAPQPSIEFLWSCALTSRVRAIAFAHRLSGPSWMTRDLSGDRFGVIELWAMHSASQLTARLCSYEPVGTEAPEIWQWFWGGHGQIGSVALPRQWMRIVPWSEIEENRAQRLARQRPEDQPLDTIQSCDFDRPFVGDAAFRAATGAPASGGTVVSGIDSQPLSLTLRHESTVRLTCLARGVSIPSRSHDRKADKVPAIVLIGDEDGQLFIVSPKDRRVTAV